jgi:hypothetical protein
MSVDWPTWEIPVSIWWGFLLIVSIVNIILWLLLNRHLRKRASDHRHGMLRIELMVLLSGAYVFGCAFRAVLPRADVQRICLFDTWLSSMLLGRSIATVAEICFAAQCAIVLHQLATSAQSGVTRNISKNIVPLILVAECCSWYAVITTSYLGNTLENSLWAVTFLLIAIGLLPLLNKFAGVVQLAIGSALLGIFSYLTFMFTIDVPMYFGRWRGDVASEKKLFGFLAGLHDASTHWVVAHDVAPWNDEIAWMSLYFSLAVWASLALASFVLIRDELPQYRAPALIPLGAGGRRLGDG